jgi:HK97 family phage prohead protease
MVETEGTDVNGLEERPKAPVELRTAAVTETNMDQRIVTVIVAPYEQPTNVMWRGEVWTESFERSAWDGIETRPNRVRANRAHNKEMTCGKAVRFFPKHPKGLVAEIRMAKTPRGDETLELCRDDCLSVSAGFAALPSDQIIDRANRSRRIKTAYLDHISFVEDPAYPGAEVLDVRENEIIIPDEPTILGPSIQDWLNDPVFAKVNEYLKR